MSASFLFVKLWIEGNIFSMKKSYLYQSSSFFKRYKIFYANKIEK